MIDLRSDTVTRPDEAMRKAIAAAEVGDDVFGEDPTVRRLEETVAGLLGKESALYVPSGVMANQVAIKAHTRPGDEIIVEERSHILLYETGAAPVISGVTMRTVRGERGLFTPDQVKAVVRGEDTHVAPVSLVCMENTHNKAGGCVLPRGDMQKVYEGAHELGLRVHLDGARIWNAATALDVDPAAIAEFSDSVTVSFSKGLGAPIGSAIAGPREFIHTCRRIRKMLGGGMRQAGIIAAGALYALENNRRRLDEDHRAAHDFAATVAQKSSLSIDLDGVQTNIVIMDVSSTGMQAEKIADAMEHKGVLFTTMDSSLLRAVTHRDVTYEQVQEAALRLVQAYPA